MQLVSFTRLIGAGSLVMYAGLKHLSSNSHPCSLELSTIQCGMIDVGAALSSLKYCNSYMVLVLLLLTRYRSQMKVAVLVAVISSKSCCQPNKPRVVCCVMFCLSTFQAFFFPILAMLLIESHPVRAWNAGRD